MRGSVALVTGGTGFVGSNLCRSLVRNGWRVHIIAIPNDTGATLLDDIRDQLDIHVHDGSIACMNSIMASARPDIVFHLASLFLSEHTAQDIDRLIISNVLFGTQLLDAMAEHKVLRIVNTGTSWQHYGNEAYSPVNLYAATKQAFEDVMRYYVEAKGLKAITLKLFDTYGPNDPRPKLFHLLEKMAHEGSLLTMSPGEQIVDLVHVTDVVAAFEIASDRLAHGLVEGHEVYAVSSGDPMTLKEVVELFGRVFGRNLAIEWGGRPYRAREVMSLWDKGKCLPGWIQTYSLETGINDLLTAKEKYES
ncbi:MAG: NAD-dependent epimerase/dehydratase family protein [Pelodictyon phaeoclathratiforme]